MVENRKHRK